MANSIKFQRNQRVNVVKNGKVMVTGTITDTHTNFCTYEQEYDVDYDKDGKTWTLICVPESAIQAINN